MTVATSPSLPARIAIALEVRAGEGRRTGLLFLHLFLASSIFILGRTVRDTLFLSRYSIAALPWMFVAYGIASSITVVLYARVADKVPRHRLVMLSSIVVATTYAGTWLVVRAEAAWIYPIFYVWAEVAANLLIVQMWTLANDLFDSRAARRLFPTIGSARILGVVVIGLATGVVVRAIGTPQLLLVLVVLILCVGVVAWRIGPPPEAAGRPAGRPRRRGTEPRILGDPHVRGLAVMLLVTFTALTIGDYQFKKIARATFQEDELARFFSLFYAGVGIVSFVFQIVATPRLLRRFGVGLGMAVMPAVFGGASALLLGVPILAIATVMKFADNGFQYTIHETTLQALYAPFAASVKARTRAFLDAVIKPVSYGLGGLVLVALASRIDVVHLSYLSVGLVVVWLAVIPSVRRRYRRALEATLGAHGAVEDGELVVGAEEHAAVLGLLQRGDPRTARVALEMLEGLVPDELRARVEQLAANAPAGLRAEALRALPRIEGASADPAVASLAEPSPEVRAAAATATAALLGDEAAVRLAPLFDDPEPHVRTAALAGVLGRCGIEGALIGGDRLGRMLRAEAPAERAEAARVLGALGPPAYAPLRNLLDDPEPTVRLAALRAAADVADRRLVPVLLGALGPAHSRDRAARALVAIGAPAAAPLVALLADAATPRALRLSLPRIVRRIPAREGYEALAAMLGTDDDHLRLRVLAALGQLRHELGIAAESTARVEELVRRELREGYGILAAWQQAREAYDRPLLAALVTRRRRGTVRRLTRVLELRYDRASLSLVRYALESPTRRANALEVLDAVLSPSLRAIVLPFLDERAPADMLAQAGDLVGPTPDPEAFLLAECRHPNPWAVAVALEALASRPSAAGLEAAESLLEHPDPLVREQALVTAAAVDQTRARQAGTRLTEDPDAIVARRARSLARPASTTPETTMRSTLEKVLLLKAAAIFRELSTEDLAPLARVSDEETHAAGTRLFAEGELGDSLYVILRGKVRVSHGGRELAVLGAGEAFGEMAVLDTAPRSATVETLEDTELLAIGSEEFYDVLREQGELAEAVIKMLSARLREANEALEGRHSTVA